MKRSISVIGAPSSAGAYAPGQEKAPSALREAGLLERLAAVGIDVDDSGDVPGCRWRPDPGYPHAMNAPQVARVAEDVRGKVSSALQQGRIALVLGGDCTVELGTVAGALEVSESVGLVYIDMDADLNTPKTTTDGALDWMGVAHLLGVNGSLPRLSGIGARNPMLRPADVCLFGIDKVTNGERAVISRTGIFELSLQEVAANPWSSASRVLEEWASRFDYLMVHLDVDILNYISFPIAENVRRHRGLSIEALRSALNVLLSASNFAALTVTEVNPDHCDDSGTRLSGLVDTVACALQPDDRSIHRPVETQS